MLFGRQSVIVRGFPIACPAATSNVILYLCMKFGPVAVSCSEPRYSFLIVKIVRRRTCKLKTAAGANLERNAKIGILVHLRGDFDDDLGLVREIAGERKRDGHQLPSEALQCHWARSGTEGVRHGWQRIGAVDEVGG